VECGLTQGELAARSGVSRQLVAAVEAGRNAPAVDAAIGLARALGTSVEELFSDTPVEAIAAVGGAPREGAPLRIGRVADRLVYAELPDHGVAGAGWASPDGVLKGGSLHLFPGSRPQGLVIAGCDPALSVAERLLDGLGARSLIALSAPTGVALRALRRGSIHAAVVHGVARELPPAPVAVVRWHLTSWQVGLGVASRWRGDSLESLLARQVPIVQRDAAAASQQAFDRARADAGVETSPAGPQASGHLEAARLAAFSQSAGVTTEGAAQAFGLDFLALEPHVVEIWIDSRWADHPGVGALGELLASRAFTDRVAQFGGYDLTRCGQPV
jgi:DNA-binding XRE family transcriptional regulator/molybdate-binding protein